MKGTARLLAFCFLLLLGASFAQLWGNYTYATDILADQSGYGTSSPYAGTPWVQSYKVIALLAALALIVGTALAYFAGGALESESLKSWGRMELAQALATAVLVACFLGVLTLMDAVMEESAKAIVPPCGPEGTWDYANARPFLPPNSPSILPVGSPRALQYAVCYLDSIYGLAGRQAESDLKSSLTFMRMAYTSQGISGTNWWSLWFGIYSRPNAEMRLQGEMSGLQFDMVKNMMISMQAQKFLVGKIAAVLGPTFLLIGIVLRTLPFTRRAGGMLLALSVGLLVVLPSAYLLSWSTLVVAVYGNEVLGSPSDDLPPGMPDACAPCRKPVPVMYNASASPPKPITAAEFPALLISDAQGNPAGYTNAKAIADYNARARKNYQACYPDNSTPGQIVDPAASKACPDLCRELPFPAYKQVCDEKACGKLPKECKVIRWINQTHLVSSAPYCEKWDDDLAFGCDAACTNECKAQLPQINATDALTPPVVIENSCAECASCPLRCKVYSLSNGARLSVGDARCDAADCQSCYSNKAKFLACSIGMSPLSSSEGCNHASLCGPAQGIADIPNGMDNTCPLECRIYFDPGKERYKDPLYGQMCDKQGNVEGRFYKACTRCPLSCKVNATAVGAYDPSGAAEFLLKPQSGSCSAAPIFDANGNMVTDKCSYCPIACRFIDPSPIDVAADPFLSHANFPISCAYKKSSLTGVAPRMSENDCRALQQAQGYDTASVYADEFRFNGLDGKDRCGPTSRVYKLHSQPQHGLCPQYYFGYAMVQDPGNSDILLTNISPQQYAAPECFDDEVKKACEEAKCPQTPCKSGWPTFCTLLNPQDRYSRIIENEVGCSACKNINPPLNTTGPQCQVQLQYRQETPINPELCDAACKDAQCKQGCFPILQLPEGLRPNNIDVCGPYRQNNDWTDTDWKDCAACPYDCRYDYGYKGAPSPPQGLSDRCGMELLSNLTNRKYLGQWYQPDPNQKYWICEDRSTYSYCNNTQPSDRLVENSTVFPQYKVQGCMENGYTCTLRATTNSYWSCQVYNDAGSKYYPDHPCYGVFAIDSDHRPVSNCDGDTEWYDDAMMCPTSWNGEHVFIDCGRDGADNGRLYADGYACGYGATSQTELWDCDDTYSDPYPGLNKFLSDTIHVTVCGALDDKSNAKNWCGNASNGTATVRACNLEVEPDGCMVEYDARVRACMGVNYNPGPPPPPDNANGCQWCPPSCRIATTPDNKIAYCASYGDALQAYQPVCDTQSCSTLCRVLAGEHKPPANFSLEPGKCELPRVGIGKFCPARCRTYYDGWTFTQAWEQYCQDTSKGYDCSDLQSQCTAPIGSRACEACTRCETDCLARPYARQNCDEACPASAEVLDFNPARMIGRWGDGIDAWPEHRTIASLGIAAVVLPLFALLITMAFVRVLSPFLGGDIEIPGLMRFL